MSNSVTWLLGVGLVALLAAGVADANGESEARSPIAAERAVATKHAASKEIVIDPSKGTVGVCQYISRVESNEVLNAAYRLSPAARLHDMLMNGYMRNGVNPAVELDMGSSRVAVLQRPKNGALGAQPDYVYRPDQGYVGEDKVVFQIEGKDLIGGQPLNFKLIYFIKVIPETIIDSSNQERLDSQYCPSMEWRISFGDGAANSKGRRGQIAS